MVSPVVTVPGDPGSHGPRASDRATSGHLLVHSSQPGASDVRRSSLRRDTSALHKRECGEGACSAGTRGAKAEH